MPPISETRPSAEIHPPAGQPTPHLAAQVMLRFLAMTLLWIVILFLPAETLHFWQGWAFLAALVTPALAAFFYFLKTNPEIVERRLRAKERVREQKRIIGFGALLFAVFTLPGFDHRFAWSRGWLGAEPLALEVFSLAMVSATILGVGWVIRTNRFAGRTIRVEEGQTVITSGLYRFVRHPFYAVSLLLWVFAPLALGSYGTLPAFALLLPIYVLRILNEEKVLRAELPGYTEYCQKTRWRIVPLVW